MKDIVLITAARCRQLLLLALAAAPLPAGAVELPPLTGRGAFNLYFENDLFTETDQNYTNGIRMSLVSPNLQSFQQQFIEQEPLRSWFEWLNPRLERFHPKSPGTGISSSDAGNNNRRVVLSLGQTIFTPQNRQATELLVDQRPYAGWLYLGVAYHARNDDQLKTVGINVGMIGPAALGQEAQDLIHDLRGFDRFQGWDNQLKNEPGLQLIYEKKDKLLSRTAGSGFGFDLLSHYGGSVGNVAIYANAGAEIRAGWRIPDDFGTSAVRPGGDNSAPGGKPRRGVGLHFFVSTDARLVVRDIFLDGNSFRQSHSVDKEPLVADAAVGVSLVYEELKLSFARILRTREFKLQPHHHDYGSLSLSWNFNL